MGKTLLEQAKEVKIKRRWKIGYNAEELDLALAYISGEITARQLAQVLINKSKGSKMSPGIATHFCTTAIRSALQAGKIKIQKI